MIDEKQITDAIKRIAQTADGKMLMLKLQHDLMRVFSGLDEHGALRQFEGRRQYAHELKMLMDASITETTSGDRTGSTDPSSRGLIVLAARSGSDIRSASPGGARRRVSATEG